MMTLTRDWLSRWRRRTVGNGSWSKLMSCRKKLTRPSDVRVNLYTIITGRNTTTSSGILRFLNCTLQRKHKEVDRHLINKELLVSQNSKAKVLRWTIGHYMTPGCRLLEVYSGKVSSYSQLTESILAHHNKSPQFYTVLVQVSSHWSSDHCARL